MVVVMGTQGGLNWQKTQEWFRDNFTDLGYNDNCACYAGKVKYGTETLYESFKCEDCKRILPVDISHADHVKAKSKLYFYYLNDTQKNPYSQKKNCEITKNPNSDTYMFPDYPLIHVIWDSDINCKSHKFNCDLDKINHQLTINYGMNKSKTIKLDDLLKLDVMNLRILCPACNLKKSNN